MKKLLCSAVAALVLIGCSDNTKSPYEGKSAGFIYAKGHEYLQKGDYTDAVTAFEDLNSQYPFQQESKQGDLELIYAYYQKDDPALALASADRFLHLYPNDPNAAYAYYMSGVIDFNNGRGFLQKYFPYDMANHHVANYDTAYKTFDVVVKRYSDSPYAADARRRMVYLNNIEAQYELNVAQFYFDRGAYVAALDRARAVIMEYPRTPSVLPALKLSQASYEKLNFPTLANTMKRVYDANQ